MDRITTGILADRIASLRRASKSGIISFCAPAGTDRDSDFFWQDHSSLVYIHELETLVFNEPDCKSYCSYGDRKAWEPYLERFIGESDGMETPVENTGWTRDGYLETVYCDLVWSMTPDDFECPDLDIEDHDERYTACNPVTIGDMEGYNAFRVCGGDSLATDISAFFSLINSGRDFSVTGKGGNVTRFFLERDDSARERSDYDTIYRLSIVTDGTYTDDSGETVPVRTFSTLLRATGPGTFYAKARTFIYLNFVQ